MQLCCKKQIYRKYRLNIQIKLVLDRQKLCILKLFKETWRDNIITVM